MPVDGPQYPVNLIVAGQSCLVVGGGAVAAGKVAGLLAAGARVTVVAPEVRDDIAGLAGVEVRRRPYCAGEAAEHRLVITATDDPAVNRQVFLDGEAAGVWVNSADDPANCSFTLPAVVRQGPIMVTVGTGGHSPAMATWLRRHVEDQLGPEYATLLELVGARRAALKEAGRSTEGLSWQEVLDSGMLDLIKAGNIAEARERLQACL